MTRCGRYCVAVVIVVVAATSCAAQTARQWATARSLMVETDVATAGIRQPAILAAMREIPRHEFVPPELRAYAYFDMALPIGERETISPPFVVGWMTAHLDPRPTDRVLEIGTGSGYQAAVLSRLAGEVYTIEINQTLALRARKVIERLGYDNVEIKVGDGYAGWAEHAPFDKIIVTCSPGKVPAPLVAQLREGGRIVIPLGEHYQQTLDVLEKRDGKLSVESREPTFFVPMTGRAESLRRPVDDAPLTPLVNGDFEELLEPSKPAVWYYLRQATLDDGGPQDSQHCLSLRNRVAGRGAQALQAIGVDGRRVHELDVELWTKAADLRSAGKADGVDGAVLAVSYFDVQNAPAGQEYVGPWQGSFDWKRQTGRVKVPAEARAAIVAVALMGATGELSCDRIEVRAAGPTTAERRR